MANRVTQVAVEALSIGPARVTQVAVETLARTVAVPAADVRQTQAVLEHARAGEAAATLRETQAALEVVHKVPALAVRETQAALEHVDYPPNAIWQTQACLEVLFPAEGFGPVLVRNYAYIGGWART